MKDQLRLIINKNYFDYQNTSIQRIVFPDNNKEITVYVRKKNIKESFYDKFTKDTFGFLATATNKDLNEILSIESEYKLKTYVFFGDGNLEECFDWEIKQKITKYPLDNFNAKLVLVTENCEGSPLNRY